MTRFRLLERVLTVVVLALGGACVFTGCSDSGSPVTPTTTATTAPPPPPVQALTADYIVTFESTWSRTTHPQDFPPNPHYSGIIGTNHRPGFRIFETGQLASDGVQSVAELGSKSPLDQGLMRAIDAGSAQRIISGGGIARSPDSVTQAFRASQDYPAVSVVLMLAPSPDWFVGVSALNLFQDGVWVEEMTLDAFPYDAGTDSGRSYAFSDLATRPPVPIALAAGPLRVAGETPRVGRFIFRRR